MISDLFMCPRGEQRETYDAMLDTPPDSATRKKHGLLLLKGLDNLVLDQLAAMLRSPDWVLDPDADDIAEERFFFELGPGFVATLAAASHDQERLRKAAELWIEAWSADLATIPAFKGTLPTHMRPRLHGEGGWWPAVVDMAALAARAHAKGWSVYLVNVP